MFGGLRPYELTPINRGCVNTVVFLAQKPDGTWIDKTGKTLYLTCKTQPWDNDSDDEDAIFKIVGVIPNPTKEPGRVVFTLTESETWLDPEKTYFVDIVETNNYDGPGEEPDDWFLEDSNRLFIGNFRVIGGPNNEQAGGMARD